MITEIGLYIEFLSALLHEIICSIFNAFDCFYYEVMWIDFIKTWVVTTFECSRKFTVSNINGYVDEAEWIMSQVGFFLSQRRILEIYQAGILEIDRGSFVCLFERENKHY